MTHWAGDDSHPRSFGILIKSALVAFGIEAIFLTLVGWQKHWLAHPPQASSDQNRFIEAEMFEMPPEAHLVEKKKASPMTPKPEIALSRKPHQGKVTQNPPAIEEENQTQSGPEFAQSHGPVAIYAPPPVIPPYLQDRDIHSHVVIDFYVNSQGAATPRLVGSSGNEELDALALEAVTQWKFRAAEKEGNPIESKVRLRIVFEVK